MVPEVEKMKKGKKMRSVKINTVQSSKWFSFVKSKVMIGRGSALIVGYFLKPQTRIWKAERQICLLNFPRGILQGELISVAILGRSPTKQELCVLNSCGASTQGHGHPWIKMFPNVDCLQPVGIWWNFFRNWNTILIPTASTDVTKLYKGALHWISNLSIHLNADPFYSKECSQEQRCVAQMSHILFLFWVGGCEMQGVMVKIQELGISWIWSWARWCVTQSSRGRILELWWHIAG